MAAVGIYPFSGELPQSHRDGASAHPVFNRQGGNVRVAAITTENFFFQKRMNTLHRSLRSRVLALPPLSGPMILLAPVADLLKIEEPLRKMRQHFLGSSKEQLGTINRSGHKLVPLRATWYWARLLLPYASWKMIMPSKNPSDKKILPGKSSSSKTPLRHA